MQYDEVATSTGPASRRIGLQKSGWAEWTFTGDRVRVWFDKTDFFGLNARVWLDGVDLGVVLIGQGSSSVAMQSWTSPVLPRGRHTIRVQESGDGGGAFWLEAVQFLDGDAARGVHVFDASHSGASASYFSDSGNPWPDALVPLAPKLVVIMLGFNDASVTTAAQFLTNLRAVVARIRAKLTDGTYTLAIVTPWALKPEPSGGWAAFVATMETVANEHPNGVSVRIHERWPNMVANQGNPGMFGNDTVHPDESGQRLLGLYVADALGLPGRVDIAPAQPRKQEITFIEGPGPNWFTTKGEYKIPPGAVAIDVDIQGPGSGGGSGRRGAASTVRCGGGGGAGGGRSSVTIPVSELPAGTASFFYSIPPSGAGGAAVTTNDTDGNNGQSVASPTFVSLVQDSTTAANLVASVWYGTGSGGKGGTATSGSAGSSTVGGTANGVSGGAASATGGNGVTGGIGIGTAGGGGAGGGITTANAASTGGSGGYSSLAYPSSAGGTGGNSTTRTGGSGGSASALYATSNGGGGGGASIASGAGAAGGSGGNYGGGGGGGSASVNAYPSGAGGDGGKGFIRFTARF